MKLGGRDPNRVTVRKEGMLFIKSVANEKETRIERFSLLVTKKMVDVL